MTEQTIDQEEKYQPWKLGALVQGPFPDSGFREWIERKAREDEQEIKRQVALLVEQRLATIVVKTDIDDVLEERGSRYGEFDEHARITQQLKSILWTSRNWGRMSFAQREALDMLMHKVGRIANGDPDYKDSWTDCIGYLRLVEQTLKD